jgi:hypothetical protein
VPVSRRLALLAAWLRVVYATLFVIALAYLVTALRLVDEMRTAGGPAHRRSGPAVRVLDAVTAFQKGWTVVLALFGVHLLVVAWLMLKSSYMPSWLTTLVAICRARLPRRRVRHGAGGRVRQRDRRVYLRRGGAAHDLAAVAGPAHDHPAAQLTWRAPGPPGGQPLPSGRGSASGALPG